MNLTPPEPNRNNENQSLHSYRPIPFVPINGWDIFWDNPPNFGFNIELNNSLRLQNTVYLLFIIS